MAPESLANREYSSRSDVYMYGCFVYEMLFRVVPFADTPNLLDVAELVNKGKRPPMLHEIDSGYENLLLACWEPKPSDRPDASAVVTMWNNLFANASSSEDSPDSSKGNKFVSQYIDSDGIPGLSYKVASEYVNPEAFVNL